MQLFHWEHRSGSRVAYLTERHGDCFVLRAEDGQVVTGFVKMTCGPGIKESSFDELGGVSTFEVANVLANEFLST